MNDETVKGLLRKAGLKVTNQRMMVLDIIASHPAEHLTAEEIYDLAKVNSPEIGLATIYRTVQVLLDLHIIDKVTFDDVSGIPQFADSGWLDLPLKTGWS